MGNMGNKRNEDKFDVINEKEIHRIQRMYDSLSDIPWIHFLHRSLYRTYIVSLEELYVRQAYGFFRRGLIFEAADALRGATAFAYEVSEEAWERLLVAVPDMAWRGSLLLRSEDIIEERYGEPFLFLYGGSRNLENMPMAVASVGWEPEERTELHETLYVDEKLLRTEPLEGSLKDYLK